MQYGVLALSGGVGHRRVDVLHAGDVGAFVTAVLCEDTADHGAAAVAHAGEDDLRKKDPGLR